MPAIIGDCRVGGIAPRGRWARWAGGHHGSDRLPERWQRQPRRGHEEAGERDALGQQAQALRPSTAIERDHDGRAAREPDSGLDAWILELVDAAPPLTRQQRRTLALLQARVPARPADATVPDESL
jgi:hypothetical protein